MFLGAHVFRKDSYFGRTHFFYPGAFHRSQWLDRLAAADPKGSGKSELFSEVIAVMSPTEQKWLAREILRDLRAGLTHGKVSEDASNGTCGMKHGGRLRSQRHAMRRSSALVGHCPRPGAEHAQFEEDRLSFNHTVVLNCPHAYVKVFVCTYLADPVLVPPLRPGALLHLQQPVGGVRRPAPARPQVGTRQVLHHTGRAIPAAAVGEVGVDR